MDVVGVVEMRWHRQSGDSVTSRPVRGANMLTACHRRQFISLVLSMQFVEELTES